LSPKTSTHHASIAISDKEWLAVCQKVRWAAALDEHNPGGHIYLSCSGNVRTWFASDGASAVTLTTTGLPVEIDGVVTDQFDVCIHSRLLRRPHPEDAVLNVLATPDARLLTMVTAGIAATLPEPFEETSPHRSFTTTVTGVSVELDTHHLRETVAAASAVPLGADPNSPCLATLQFEDGFLTITPMWEGYESARYQVLLDECQGDTPGFLAELNHLQNLCNGLEAERCTLTLPLYQRQSMRVSTSDFEAVLSPQNPWVHESHLLRELLGNCFNIPVIPDDDGDIPLNLPDGTQCWARLSDNHGVPVVEFFSVLATGLSPDAHLFEELNAINSTANGCTLTWDGDVVRARTYQISIPFTERAVLAAITALSDIDHKYRSVLAVYFNSTDDDWDIDDDYDSTEQLEF